MQKARRSDILTFSLQSCRINIVCHISRVTSRRKLQNVNLRQRTQSRGVLAGSDSQRSDDDQSNEKESDDALVFYWCLRAEEIDTSGSVFV
jgi:hypothetical protein